MSASERPGVYSSYEVSSSLTGSGGGGIVGVAGRAESGTALTVIYTIDSYAEAVTAFGAASNLAALIKLLFLNGASSVRAVAAAVGAVPSTENYTAAFTKLMEDDTVRIMTCDSQTGEVLAAMASAIAGGSEGSRYRIGVAEHAGTAATAVAQAEALNSERMVLCAPGAVDQSGTAAVPGSVAAAVAGAIAATTDPALPMNGAVLRGLEKLSARFADSNINTLVQGGVTPVESVAGEISVVRGVTTRTKTAGEADATWRELTTIRIVDDVIPTVRAALRTRFARTKNTAQTRGAIRTQVVIELENKLAQEIIDGYGDVTVAASATDPTVCEVGFAFTVAHGLNQIRLTAHITV